MMIMLLISALFASGVAFALWVRARYPPVTHTAFPPGSPRSCLVLRLVLPSPTPSPATGRCWGRNSAFSRPVAACAGSGRHLSLRGPDAMLPRKHRGRLVLTPRRSVPRQARRPRHARHVLGPLPYLPLRPQTLAIADHTLDSSSVTATLPHIPSIPLRLSPSPLTGPKRPQSYPFHWS